MRDFTKYEVWNLAIDLSVEIYRITESLPNQEKFGLISQMNRAVVSIASNIAEGTSRSSEKEFIRFLEISMGSGFELKSQLVIAHRLEFIDSSTFDKVMESLDLILKQLNGLRSSIISS